MSGGGGGGSGAEVAASSAAPAATSAPSASAASKSVLKSTGKIPIMINSLSLKDVGTKKAPTVAEAKKSDEVRTVFCTIRYVERERKAFGNFRLGEGNAAAVFKQRVTPWLRTYTTILFLRRTFFIICTTAYHSVSVLLLYTTPSSYWTFD